MRVALPPGNDINKLPSKASYEAVNAPVPEYAMFVHVIPDCSNLRPFKAPAKLTNPRPDSLSEDRMFGGENVREIETFAALATSEDTSMEEPLIGVVKTAGNDPEELGASTFPNGSIMADSRASIAGRPLSGCLKVPNEKESTVLAGTSEPNTNSTSDDVKGLTRTKEMRLVNPV
jgi:hypothetical protein